MFQYIMIPIIGAIIGYATNWIAVKMLFHPRKAIYLGSWKLPFTPGVIPKGQSRLAAAVGKMVETQLLTKEVLYEQLTSDKVEEQMKNTCQNLLRQWESSEETVKEAALQYIPEGNYQNAVMDLESNLSDLIYEKTVDLDLGQIIADQGIEAVKEKLADSFLAMMLTDSVLEPIAGHIRERINDFIRENVGDYIYDLVKQESENLQGKTLGDGAALIEEYQIPVEEIVLRIYHSLLENHLDSMIQSLDFAGIVERRINAMAVEEVEELVLVMMKKELGAIVNLGAVIGLLLGLVNLAILLI